MKRIHYAFFIILALLLSGCSAADNDTQKELSNVIGNSNEESEPQPEESSAVIEKPQQTDNEDSVDNETRKILVAYFSWAENAVQDNIDAMTSASVRAPGNVAQLAAWVAEKTGGELFSIQVSEPYPADWDGCLVRANEEKANDTHPELVQAFDNIEDYDVVFLGYPNWWYSCPMAIHSFLDVYDFSGKQVYLFCSHGTGGLANSVNDIAADIPEAELSEDVFHVYQDDTDSAKEDLMTWLDGLENESGL